MGPSPSRPGRAFRIVTVASVEVRLPDQYPMVTLEDAEVPGRTLSFRIGMAEGVALSHALAGTESLRPSTHDLFAAALQRYAVDVLAVRLVGRVGPTYVAELDLVGGHGREVLSCRPSDGICLALRQRVPAPVLADDRLFTEGGDVLPDEPAVQEPPVHEPAVQEPGVQEPAVDEPVAALEEPVAEAPEPAEAGA
jgi:uncharacterized protein